MACAAMLWLAPGIAWAIGGSNGEVSSGTGSSCPPPVAPPPPASAVTLSFPGLSAPDGVAVDAAGDVAVADSGNNRVLELPYGSSNPETLPLTGLNDPTGVAFDNSGDVFVTDTLTLQVLELPAGSSNQVPLPCTGLHNPFGIAVDAAGDVYVADTGNNRVLELPAGSSSQITLPFTGLSGPADVAVDRSGDVFVADNGNHRVLELSPPPSQPVPFINIGPLAVQAGLASNLHYEITLTGGNFQDWSEAQVTGPTGQYASFIPCPRAGDELGIAVPASFLATPGTRTVRVVTPGTGGSTSNLQRCSSPPPTWRSRARASVPAARRPSAAPDRAPPAA